MSTEPKKTRKRNRLEMADALGRACYDGFMGCCAGADGQPSWEVVPERARLPWIAGAKGAVDEFIAGIAKAQRDEATPGLS